MHIDRAAELRRWQDSGAVWEVIARTGRSVTIGLVRCDGGDGCSDRYAHRRRFDGEARNNDGGQRCGHLLGFEFCGVAPGEFIEPCGLA